MRKRKAVALLIVIAMIFSVVIAMPAFSTSKHSVKTAKAQTTSNPIEVNGHGLGCKPSPVKNWSQINIQELNNELKSKGISPTALPSSVDLSSGEPPVGDQGAQGSCTAWATGYYYKTYQEGKEQNWDLTKKTHEFSPAFVYNQINGGQDAGSSISDALQLLTDKGCDTLAVFPYDDHDYTTQPTQDQLNEAAPFKAHGFANVFQGQGNCTDDTINTLKEWLANGDTFVIAIPVYDMTLFMLQTTQIT